MQRDGNHVQNMLRGSFLNKCIQHTSSIAHNIWCCVCQKYNNINMCFIPFCHKILITLLKKWAVVLWLPTFASSSQQNIENISTTLASCFIYPRLKNRIVFNNLLDFLDSFFVNTFCTVFFVVYSRQNFYDQNICL